MRSTIGKLFLVTAITATAAILSYPAQAQTVTVPFNFTAQGHSYPAGVYKIEKDSLFNFVTVHELDGKKAFLTMLGAGNSSHGDNRVVLRFAVVGNGHALDTIQFGDRISPRLNRFNAREAEMESVGGQ